MLEKRVEKKWDLKKIISSKSYYINRDAKMNSRKCEVCNIDVHRASYVKHQRSEKHLENKNKMTWLYQIGSFKNVLKIKLKVFPKSLKQLARDNFRLDDKQLQKVFAEKMINP